MRREWIICCLLAGITLAVYWPVRHHDFLCYDDPQFITQNPYIQNGLNRQSVSYALTAVVTQNWHPVTTLSHILDCEFFGLNPGPHHLVSVAFHTLNAMLLLLLLRKMTGFFWRSAVVAALFALHPLRVESVAWIAERKDVLGGFFFLLTLLAYAKYAEESAVSGQWSVAGSQACGTAAADNGPRTTDHGPRAAQHASRFYALALVFFALGLMSKPMLVTLPCVLLLLDFWPLGRFQLSTLNPQRSTGLGPLLREKLPFFWLSGFSCWITVRAQHGEHALSSLSHIGLMDRVTNTIVSYLQYPGKMFWPADLAVLYPHPGLHYPVLDQWPGWEIVAGALLLLAISALCLCQLRRRPFLAVGWFWYLGTLVPVIGLVQVGEQAMADRYTYIPLIGPALALVWLLSELARPLPSEPGRDAFHRVRDFAGKEWDAVERVPTGLGGAACLPGIFQFSIPRPSARQLFLTALTLLALSACAVLSRRQVGYWRNSVTLFEHTVEVTPDNPIAQCNLGYGLFLEGKPSLAAVRYRAALAINPRYAQAHFNLGGVLKDEERWPEAAEQYLAVTHLKPDFFLPHLALAQILPRLGRLKDAAFQMEEFLRTCPGSNLESPNSPMRAPALGALNDLAWFLATGERAEHRDGGRAVRFAERACELTQYRQAIMVGTLAAAYAEAGRLPEAVTTAEMACTLATQAGDQALLEKNQHLLELYRAGQPCREPAPQTPKDTPAR